MIKFVNYLFFVIILSSCDGETIDFPCYTSLKSDLFPCHMSKLYSIYNGVNPNPIFIFSDTVFIPPYSFETPDYLAPKFGNYIEVSGDDTFINMQKSIHCCEIANQIDVYSNSPVFQWTSFNRNLMAVAVFKDQISFSVDGIQIQNINDIVWTWNSGMNTGSSFGNSVTIEYWQGKDVLNGMIQSSTTPLASGKAYTWAVWGWNESGITVEFSSRAIPFIVDSLSTIPLISFRQLSGEWTLQSANNIAGSDKFSEFPIKKIFFEDACDTEVGLEYISGPNLSFGLLDTIANFVIDSVMFNNVVFICDEKVRCNTVFRNEIITSIFMK